MLFRSKMIDIGLTNALAQIRDALYEISDTLKDAKEAEDISNKCENCLYKTYYEQGYI